MALITLEELVSKPGRLIGLDVGTKTVGLAFSDATRSIATPFSTYNRKGWKQDLPYLSKLIDDERVVACVVGLPLNMDGSESQRSEYVRDFVAHLTEVIQIPILFWDERLSTIAVERVLLDADLSRKRRAEVVDKMAASYILQGVLDRLRNMR